MSKLKKPVKLSLKRIQPFLTPGLILLIIILSGFLILRPRIEKISLVQRDLARKEDRLTKLTAKVAALEGLDEFELALKAELATKAFPAEKNFPLFLSVLKRLTLQNNLETIGLKVTPGEIATVSAQPKSGSPSLMFTVNLAGQMADLKQFLAQVAQTAPLMIVHNLKVSVAGETVEASFSLEGPFLALPTTLGKVEKPLVQVTPQEEEVYQELAKFDFSLIEGKPLFTVPSGKEDPFNF